MAGRPLGRQTLGALVAQLEERVKALERRRAVSGHYEIKLFADDEAVAVGDGRFMFNIPYNLDKAKLRYLNIYVTTAGSGPTTVQLHNNGSVADPANFDMLNTPITIESGELDAETNFTTPWEIAGKEFPPADPSYAIYGFPYTDNTVFFKQQIRIDIDAAGSGAMGLGIQLGIE